MVTQSTTTTNGRRDSTGIAQLDQVLHGGFLPKRAYLVRGGPGSGKTTLGQHFLSAAEDGRGLFISLGESKSQLSDDAVTQGVDLGKITFLDLSPTSSSFADDNPYDIFEPAEVEGQPMKDTIIEAVDKHRPSRIFIDSVTQLRYLTPDAYQFRKMLIAALRFMTERGATVLFASESSPEAPDEDVQFLVDGIVELEKNGRRRSIQVSKFRGSGFIDGAHDLRIGPRGLEVFPRLIPEYHGRDYEMEALSFGVPEIDEMLGGGIERGTLTVLSGPTGVGKTTFGLQFMKEAAARGERSVVVTFEERQDTTVERCTSINIPIETMVKQGNLVITEIEALGSTPDQLAVMLRDEVERRGTRIVMLDSIAGYRVSLAGENLITHLHALCRYLVNMGVTVLLPNEVETIAGGDFRATDAGISYLADNIILLRYLEIGGELRKSIGVLKKRSSDFQKSLREFEITRFGIRVGEPLSGMRGLLSGAPEKVAASERPASSL